MVVPLVIWGVWIGVGALSSILGGTVVAIVVSNKVSELEKKVKDLEHAI